MSNMKLKISLVVSALVSSALFMNCSSTGGDPAAGAGPGPTRLNYSPTCFSPSSSNPVLTGGSLFAGSAWNDPTVLKVGSQYVMYASSDISFNHDIKIYRMVSNDGISWALSPSSAVFTANPSGTSWDHRAVETPSVVYFNGKYHMFYTGYATTYTDTANFKIGHATSNDGIAWTRDVGALLAPSDPTGAPNLDFNQYIVAEPGAVVFNNKIYLYFSALGANTGVNTTLQVIGLTTSSDGTTWSAPQKVLEPDQTLYPRATWIGYSTPQPVVMNDEMHLFFDVVQASPWKQLRLHHASSGDGSTSWSHDSAAIYMAGAFPWATNEIRSPAPLLDGTTLKLWFAGDNGAVLGIGQADCAL